jgi:hypothetical protein
MKTRKRKTIKRGGNGRGGNSRGGSYSYVNSDNDYKVDAVNFVDETGKYNFNATETKSETSNMPYIVGGIGILTTGIVITILYT